MPAQISRSLMSHLLRQPIQLMLNCVGGPATSAMTRFLGENAHLVSYGAMSKKPLSIPTSAFIFKNLKAHGYWQSRWYKEHSRQDREELMEMITAMKVSDSRDVVRRAVL